MVNEVNAVFVSKLHLADERSNFRDADLRNFDAVEESRVITTGIIGLSLNRDEPIVMCYRPPSKVSLLPTARDR